MASHTTVKAQPFISTAQLLASDGILLSRAHASTPDPLTAADRMQGGASTAPRHTASAGATRGGGPQLLAAAAGGGGGAIHDNYLTGSRVAIPNSDASDPGDLHSLPKATIAAGGGFRYGQVTAAARSCSGELVEVPHLGAHRNNISATHPSVDGGLRYDRHFIYKGNAAPTARTISEEIDATIRGEVDTAQALAAKAAQINRWATIVQSIVRMRAERRRYLLHRERLTTLLERVFYERQMRCALLIQKCAKRMVARHRYLRTRDAQWQRLINGGNKRKGGLTSMKSMVGGSSSTAGGGARAALNRRPSVGGSVAAANSGKFVPLPQEPYPWLEGIAERNFTFVVALKAMIAGRLEEAKHAFETFSQQSGQQGGDKVALRLAHCCDARIRTITNLANGGRDPGADKKGGAGGKGAGAKGKGSPAKRR